MFFLLLYYSIKNIECGYSFEEAQQLQHLFLSKNKKNII